MHTLTSWMRICALAFGRKRNVGTGGIGKRKLVLLTVTTLTTLILICCPVTASPEPARTSKPDSTMVANADLRLFIAARDSLDLHIAKLESRMEWQANTDSLRFHHLTRQMEWDREAYDYSIQLLKDSRPGLLSRLKDYGLIALGAWIATR